ncbi:MULTISPECIES: substrate-binding domain-containing protein [unclassified Streptomyces]|uniref:substrate-binding domain-containing protein n=1 Tax=unclassified Streptomyces TaxID=2593676 RepID=UPI001E2FF2FE|nr:substrate-binding domain-containing protein [Streptomyces sp. CB02980]MCB8906825.1 substrate-binding domain-containing protein [Streptomyces sp. CB02980]
MNKKKTGLAFAVAALAVVTIGGGLATADPAGPPQFRQLSGVGSDTTQDVMNGLADVVTVNGQKVIGSYDATGSANITTKSAATNPNCTIARPNGSGAGRSALLNSLQAGNGCLDFARSSSLSLGAANPGLTYVPFAVDAVSYAITPGSAIPRKLTLADLKAIYHCDPAYVGAGPNYDMTVYLPQAGSGTRSFWQSQMGITEADVVAGIYPCIKDKKGTAPVQEHDGRVLDDKSIVPFSIAQYQSQSSQTIADLRGRAILGTVDGLSPTVLNSGFGVKRDVYNVIPTSKVGVSPWSDVFVGPNSGVCKQTSVINTYGFATNPNCGDTTKQTP